jgi:hypothetical protein
MLRGLFESGWKLAGMLGFRLRQSATGKAALSGLFDT